LENSLPRNDTTRQKLFENVVTIRAFEETLLAQFHARGMTGTTHTCIGQEAIAVAAMAHREAGDIVFSNHRSHGHFLAYGGTSAGLLHEIAGHAEGVCGGLGGSQHLSYRDFYSNGILGGTIAVANGMAFAEKLKKSGHIAFCFTGDGVFGEGLIYEALNLASLWSIPLLLIVEDNKYAQTTPSALNRAGSLVERIQAFGIEVAETDSNDVYELDLHLGAAARHVRDQQRPYAQIVTTYRLSPHSKGDDFRDAAELKQAWASDPLKVAFSGLKESVAREIEERVRNRIVAEFDSILGSDFRPRPVSELADDTTLVPKEHYDQSGFFDAPKEPRLLDHLNQVFSSLLDERTDLYLLGEDLLDPYGGAFKVYSGLSTRHPQRVLTTPISEAGIIGLANGMAIRGLRPVVEIMFGDFLGLAMDQLLNHACKFERMYGGTVRCPIVVRTPMGGRRGYGPTHSQSIEKHFLGMPGLAVVAASTVHDQKLIWDRVLALGAPTLFVENKTLYAAKMLPLRNGKVRQFHAVSSHSHFPTLSFQLSMLGEYCDCAIITYGGGVGMALDAATACFVNDELSVRVIVLSQLAPLPIADILAALGRCRRVVTLEEGTARWGFGAEVVAMLVESGGARDWRFRRCAARDTIIPNAAAIEDAVLPQTSDVIAAISRLMEAP
jgi:2-oxoisovalerate dehydrogenase E1 component